MPATKSFTARSLPALLQIAEGCGFTSSKVDRNTYDFALPGLENLRRGVSEGEVARAKKLADEIERTFRAYDLHVDCRARFVRVTWTKGSRSLVQTARGQ